ncbi:UPF0160 protein-like protein isoform X1, partial [Tanacetum coccineum]
ALMSMGRAFKNRLRRREVKQSWEFDIVFKIVNEYSVKVNKGVAWYGDVVAKVRQPWWWRRDGVAVVVFSSAAGGGGRKPARAAPDFERSEKELEASNINLEAEMKIDHVLKYVIYQDDRNDKWRVQEVAISPNNFKNIKPLPSHYTDDHLSQLAGISECVFVYSSGFTNLFHDLVLIPAGLGTE